jgi:hypothetical protein
VPFGSSATKSMEGELQQAIAGAVDVRVDREVEVGG